MRTIFTRAAFGAAFTLALFANRSALAADGEPCTAFTDEDNGVPTLYIENGDTQEPLIKRIGKQLLQSSTKLRIIYRNRPTCNIRTDMFSHATMTAVSEGTPPAPRIVRYIPASATFDPTTGSAPSCTVPALGDPAAKPIVLGIGATYLSSCAQTPAQPADVAVLEGPTQAYGFITNKNSKQVAITAEEAYLAYGFTEGGGDANPWVVQDLRFKRGNTASTTLVMSSAMNLLPAQMKAHTDSTTSEDIVTGVVGGAANPDATLGILGMDLYDALHRNDVHVLAFKTFGQTYAYFPDKTNASFDKQNVRDGHYVPWAPTPYISTAASTSATTFTDANAERFYELVMGTRTGDDVDGLLSVVGSGLVPKCAMKVTRTDSGQPLTLYRDPAPCGCYFDKTVPQGATTCTACTDNTPCGGGICRHGYCEAK
jgi:hypothetical protein